MPVTTVRKFIQGVGFIGPALMLVLLTFQTTANGALAVLTVAIGCTAFTQAGFLVNFQEIRPAVRGRAARHGQHRGLVRGDRGHVHDGGHLREHGLVARGVVHHRGRLRVRSGDVAGVQHGREGL